MGNIGILDEYLDITTSFHIIIKTIINQIGNASVKTTPFTFTMETVSSISA